MDEPAIEVEHLTLAYGGEPVLRDIAFSLNQGKFLAIIGPNGAGKTTLLKCLGGLLRPGSGSVKIEGRNIRQTRQRDLSKRISYVPQAAGGALPWTVGEFIRMARYPHLGGLGRFTETDRQAVLDAMDLTGCTRLEERRLDTLSGGERQTVFIAAALAQGGRILLLDEPTTFLDYRHQGAVLALIQRLHHERGYTIVSVSHDLNQGAMTGDAILALKAGKVAYSGTPSELRSGGILEELYETRFDYVDHPESGDTWIVPRHEGSRHAE